jgi:hypothetical protein
MQFVRWTNERKHDLGLIRDPEKGEWLGSAMCCGPSATHPDSISVNAREFRAATKCFQYLILRCGGGREKILPMHDAMKLVENYSRRIGEGEEYFVLNWSDIDNSAEFPKELPF